MIWEDFNGFGFRMERWLTVNFGFLVIIIEDKGGHVEAIWWKRNILKVGGKEGVCARAVGVDWVAS